jgi:hypothetical protein
MDPFNSIFKTLAPKRPNENDEGSLTRMTAALAVLSHIAELKLKWLPEYSRELIEFKGLDKLIEILISKSQWLRTSSSTILNYITSSGAMYKDIASRDGVKRLVRNLTHEDNTIRVLYFRVS